MKQTGFFRLSRMWGRWNTSLHRTRSNQTANEVARFVLMCFFINDSSSKLSIIIRSQKERRGMHSFGRPDLFSYRSLLVTQNIHITAHLSLVRQCLVKLRLGRCTWETRRSLKIALLRLRHSPLYCLLWPLSTFYTCVKPIHTRRVSHIMFVKTH